MTDTSHPYVLVKSSLDVLGLYLTTLRERFSSAGANFPWYWNDQDSLSRIWIEAGAGDETRKNDARPAIYVDRSAIVFAKIVIGDFAGQNLETGLKAFYSTGVGQINMDCVSKNRGESALLGDLVQGFMLMSSDEILAAYSLRDCTPLTLGPTEPWEKDNRLFATRVTSEVTFDVKWATRPDTRKLQRVSVSVGTQPIVDYHSIAVTSLSRLDIRNA